MLKYFFLIISIIVFILALIIIPLTTTGDGWSAIFAAALILFVVMPVSLSGTVVSIIAIIKNRKREAVPMFVLWVLLIINVINSVCLFVLGPFVPIDGQGYFFLVPLCYLVTSAISLVLVISNWKRI